MQVAIYQLNRCHTTFKMLRYKMQCLFDNLVPLAHTFGFSMGPLVFSNLFGKTKKNVKGPVRMLFDMAVRRKVRHVPIAYSRSRAKQNITFKTLLAVAASIRTVSRPKGATRSAPTVDGALTTSNPSFATMCATRIRVNILSTGIACGTGTWSVPSTSAACFSHRRSVWTPRCGNEVPARRQLHHCRGLRFLGVQDTPFHSRSPRHCHRPIIPVQFWDERWPI